MNDLIGTPVGTVKPLHLSLELRREDAQALQRLIQAQTVVDLPVDDIRSILRIYEMLTVGDRND